MKLLLTIWLLLVLANCFAQEETFTVKANHNIFISPSMDTLQANTKYTFKTLGNGAKEIADIKFTGGSVFITDSGIILQTVKIISRARKYSLKFFSKQGKVLTEIWNKNFTILSPTTSAAELPVYTWPKLPHDFTWLRFRGYSGTDTFTLTAFAGADKRIVATEKYNPSTNLVTFFKIKFNYKGSSETLTSVNGVLTYEMTKKLKTAGPGDVITLSEVRCKGTKEYPDEVILGPYKVLIKE